MLGTPDYQIPPHPQPSIEAHTLASLRHLGVVPPDWEPGLFIPLDLDAFLTDSRTKASVRVRLWNNARAERGEDLLHPLDFPDGL